VQLEDLRQLRDYGIEGGAVLAHVPPELGGGGGLHGPQASTAAAAPRERVDYAQVARLLAAAREETLGGRAQDPADYVPGGTTAAGGDWASGWTGGGAWRDYPLVMGGGGGGGGGGGSHLPSREDVVLPPESEEEADAGGSGGSAGGVSAAFLASAGDDELAHAEARLLARSAALDTSGAGGGGSGSGGEVDSNASVPRSPVSERKGGLVGGGGTAGGAAANGAPSAAAVGGTPTATEAAAARERAQVKAALRRVREARRARQAIVWRGPDDVVPFSESGGSKAGIAVA
jgi:hypothetical protein